MVVINPKLLGVPDVLVHLAWIGLPNYKDLFHFEVNLPADYIFLKAMITAGTRHVLVTAISLEYGKQSGPLTEDMLTFPTNPYGLAKDALRKFLQALQQSIFGWNIQKVRVSLTAAVERQLRFGVWWNNYLLVDK